MITLTAKLYESDFAWIEHNIAPVDQEWFVRRAVTHAIEQERARRLNIQMTLKIGAEFHDAPTDSIPESKL